VGRRSNKYSVSKTLSSLLDMRVIPGLDPPFASADTEYKTLLFTYIRKRFLP
jgi:hypothetical protein